VDDLRRKRWERRTSGPLLVGALLFLVAYAWPILQPDLPRAADLGCRATSALIWVAFGVDLVARLLLSERRVAFLRRHWLDVATLLLPFLRPLRALRAVVALDVIARRGGTFARGRAVVSIAITVLVVGGVASLAVLDAERGKPGANIENFGDAIWWAAVTTSTVGYGDRYPTTAEGRLVAVGLMGTGIALLGVITAALASWFVEQLSQVQRAEEETGGSVAHLTAEIRALREEVRAIREERS
jgi:voltage-gated potassium channel